MPQADATTTPAAPADPVVDPGVASAPPVQAAEDSTTVGGGMAGMADETPVAGTAPMAGTGTTLPGEEDEDASGTGTPTGTSAA